MTRCDESHGLSHCCNVVRSTLALLFTPALAADAPREPYGINLEGFAYP